MKVFTAVVTVKIRRPDWRVTLGANGYGHFHTYIVPRFFLFGVQSLL